MGSAPASNDDGNYFDLGSYHRTITTNNPTAQVWFDRGFIWSYGFNRAEALACFEKVVNADPDCAMGYWGLAYACGAYYNKPWHLHDKKDLKSTLERAFHTSRQAQERASQATPVERALIEALVARYRQATPGEDLKAWDRAYAESMSKVYKEYPRDIDVVVLYAESLMNLTPWQLWDPYTGEPASSEARPYEAKAALDHGFTLEGAYEHPGLLHLYIHMIEMSREPELGIRAADALRHLVPEGGHLNHMPAHLDVLYGDYRNAIAANAAGVKADNKYLERTGDKGMYNMYRAHAYHSLIYAAMLAGKSQVALENVTLMEDSISTELLRIESPPMADWLETFVAVRPHVLIRFGRWDELCHCCNYTLRKEHCMGSHWQHCRSRKGTKALP